MLWTWERGPPARIRMRAGGPRSGEEAMGWISGFPEVRTGDRRQSRHRAGDGQAAAPRKAADVAICSRSQQRLDAAMAELKTYGVKLLTVAADLLEAEAADRVMDVVDREWGGVQILVNNVGGGGRWGKEIVEDTDMRVWGEVYEKNAMAAVRFTRRALPHMRRGKWGRVVTITSIYGGKEGIGRPWFTMAKAAETGLMKSLSAMAYLVRDGITFNSVAPGGIYIPGTGFEDEQQRDPEGFRRMVDAEYPPGRLGTPEEVAAVVAFLLFGRGEPGERRQHHGRWRPEPRF